MDIRYPRSDFPVEVCALVLVSEFSIDGRRFRVVLISEVIISLDEECALRVESEFGDAFQDYRHIRII